MMPVSEKYFAKFLHNYNISEIKFYSNKNHLRFTYLIMSFNNNPVIVC